MIGQLIGSRSTCVFHGRASGHPPEEESISTLQDLLDSLPQHLLADDETTFRQATAELFRERGYSCDETADAQEAAAQLRLKPYDVAILDVGMPGNTDLELLDVPATLEDPPLVILITGYPMLLSGSADERRAETTKPPVTAYLVKPFRFEELLRRVEQIIPQQDRP